MNIQLPKYHNLQGCDLRKEFGQYLRVWEVGVPLQDSLEWSIVMAYLSTAYFSKEEELRNRLVALGDCADDFIEIKRCFSCYNPFLNRYGCFYNRSLRKVVSAFKEKLRSSSLPSSEDTDCLASKLEFSSELLNSSIALATTKCDGDIETVVNFPSVSNSDSTFETKMTLYHRLSEPPRFHFGMKKEKGYQLKKAAFTRVLKQANIHKKRRAALFFLDTAGESFVTSVVKSDCRNSIPNLYKSAYHAWKLAEAGFEMDPRVVDSSGFSALYYAMLADDEKLLYTLHNYAANACYSFDKSLRDPDELILENLVNLGEIIARDIQNLRHSGNENEDVETVTLKAEQLIRFNEFLIQVCRNILIGQKVNLSDVLPEVSEAIVRKNVTLALLQTYDSFFAYENSDVSENDILLLNCYNKYDTYYRNLDNAATLFFFDNIFHLKERLLLESDTYSELESSFFLSVLSNKHFSNETAKLNFFFDRHSDCQNRFDDVKSLLSFPDKIKYFKFIPLLERLRLREKVRSFIKTLNEVDVPGSIVKGMPVEEASNTLEDFPEIKDELMISRLVHYLKPALEQNEESVKHSLVIERALQVLGETLVYGNLNRTSLCFLLFASIPKSTYRILKNTRNILSHLNEYVFVPKFKAEKNYSFFRDIQKDIRNVYEEILGVIEIQQLRLIEFIFKRGLREIEDNLSASAKRELLLSSDELSEALAHLQMEDERISKVKSVSSYRYAVYKNQNLIENLNETTDDKFVNAKSWSPKLVFEILWPLKYFLTLIAKDYADLNSKIQEVLCDSEDALNCPIDEMKNKSKECWQKCKMVISELRGTVLPQNSQRKVETSGVHIDKFKRILRGFAYLSQDEKNEIRSHIPEKVTDSVNLKREMLKSLELDIAPTREQISKFHLLFLSKTNHKKLKKTEDVNETLEIMRTAEDPIADLNSILDGSGEPMKKEAFKKLCDRLDFSDDIRKKLSKLNDVGQKKFPAENKLSNILNRIKLLKEILIDENPNIHELWNNAKHVKSKAYASHKIVQRYVRDPEVQASVEMLLFDCMHMLGNETEIGKLWIKSRHLFSGINLRNVLGHGNPTLENIGKLLDPDDLPSGLVNEMLNLIEDEAGIQAMHDLCLKADLDFDGFHVLINDDDSTEHIELRRKILDTKESRWKRYSKLLPRDGKKIKVLSSVRHSVSVDCEECNAGSAVGDNSDTNVM